MSGPARSLKRLVRPALEWVRVADRHPLESQKVIAIYEDVYHHRIVTFWRDGGGTPHYGHPNERDGKGSQPATHWHPLPELPNLQAEGRGSDATTNT